MTFLPPEGPLPELSTTRVGGGSSARLIAVGVVGVLVAVVGLTVVNRPPGPPSPGPTAPAVAVAPTPLATPARPHNQLKGDDGILAWPVIDQLGTYGRPTPAAFVYSYTALIPIRSGIFRAPLDPDVPDDYRAAVTLAKTDVGKLLPIEIGRQRTVNGLNIYQSFASWQVKLQPLLRSRGGIVVLLVAAVPPDLTPGLPGPLASGYTFTLIGKRVGSQLRLFLELIWSTTAQLADFEGPRNPAYFNRCRWDVGPLAAPPRPGTNEADC